MCLESEKSTMMPSANGTRKYVETVQTDYACMCNAIDVTLMQSRDFVVLSVVCLVTFHHFV